MIKLLIKVTIISKFSHALNILDNKYILNIMKISGEITFRYKNEDNAKVVFDSLDVDNENYLTSDLNKELIKYTVNNEKLGSFLATVDDLIASEIVVEKIVSKTKQ